MEKLRTVRALCFVFPNGNTRWIESRDARKNRDKISTFIGRWRIEHEEFRNSDCGIGAVEIVMSEEAYKQVKKINLDIGALP